MNETEPGAEPLAPRRRRPRPILTVLVGALCVLATTGYWGESYDVSWENLKTWGLVQPELILDGAWWGVVTSVLVHPLAGQVLFAFAWLALLGAPFERTYGSPRWLLFFLGAAFVSGGVALGTDMNGVGTTGVGYAFLGFGWVARERVWAFKLLKNRWVMAAFLGWLLAGPAFHAEWGYLGDVASAVAGLLFGAAVAAAFVQRRWLIGVPATAAIAVVAALPFFWCPWSSQWNAFHAWKAHERKDHAAAVRWYRRSLALGYEPTWVWQGLTEIHGERREEREYAEALRRLRGLDPQAADTAVRSYGKPGRWDDRVPHWAREEPVPGVPQE